MARVWLPANLGGVVGLPAGFDAVATNDVPDDPDDLAEVEFYVPALDVPGLRSPRMKGRPLVERMPAYLDGMPRLKVLQTLSAGLNQIPMSVLSPDVTLCSAAGVHSGVVSEMGMTLILSSLRGIPDLLAAQRREHWLTEEWLREPPRTSLADHRVVIAGYGAIGESLARKLEPFDCEIVRIARHARPGVLAESALWDELPTADVVVLLMPLIDATRRIADAAFLARMKCGALLVNLGRGGLVDTDALLAELRTGRILAALDVTDPEPLPEGHALWRAPGVIISPHASGITTALVPRLAELVTAQLRRYADGEPLRNVVPLSTRSSM